MGSLAAALVALSQGVVFFHAGDEILRSKSLDRDSYGSGAALATAACPPARGSPKGSPSMVTLAILHATLMGRA